MLVARTRGVLLLGDQEGLALHAEVGQPSEDESCQACFTFKQQGAGREKKNETKSQYHPSSMMLLSSVDEIGCI